MWIREDWVKAFPNEFLWGATLTGHQVEGENFDSDWWRWEQRPGRIHGGSTSQQASEHLPARGAPVERPRRVPKRYGSYVVGI